MESVKNHSLWRGVEKQGACKFNNGKWPKMQGKSEEAEMPARPSRKKVTVKLQCSLKEKRKDLIATASIFSGTIKREPSIKVTKSKGCAQFHFMKHQNVATAKIEKWRTSKCARRRTSVQYRNEFDQGMMNERDWRKGKNGIECNEM